MYHISLWDPMRDWNEIATVCDCKTAYDAYYKACEFAKLVGADCALIDAETYEVLLSLEDDGEEETF